MEENIETLKTLRVAHKLATVFRFCSGESEVEYIMKNFNFDDEYLLRNACEEYAGFTADDLVKLILNTIDEL